MERPITARLRTGRTPEWKIISRASVRTSPIRAAVLSAAAAIDAWLAVHRGEQLLRQVTELLGVHVQRPSVSHRVNLPTLVDSCEPSCGARG